MMIRVVVMGLSIAFGATPVTTQLDQAINQTPTVRSEIKNGYETAGRCTGYQMPAQILDSCLDRIVADYRIAHPSSEAFLVGLNIRKWIAGANYVSLEASLPGNRLAMDYAIYGRISAGQAETEARSGAVSLKITLDQAFEAAGVVEANRPKSVLN